MSKSILETIVLLAREGIAVQFENHYLSRNLRITLVRKLSKFSSNVIHQDLDYQSINTYPSNADDVLRQVLSDLKTRIERTESNEQKQNEEKGRYSQHCEDDKQA